MMWLLYVGLVALVVTCAALTPAMKRAGEREWTRYRWRMTMSRAQAALSDLTSRMSDLNAAAARAAKALHQMGVLMGTKVER